MPAWPSVTVDDSWPLDAGNKADLPVGETSTPGFSTVQFCV